MNCASLLLLFLLFLFPGHTWAAPQKPAPRPRYCDLWRSAEVDFQKTTSHCNNADIEANRTIANSKIVLGANILADFKAVMNSLNQGPVKLRQCANWQSDLVGIQKAHSTLSAKFLKEDFSNPTSINGEKLLNDKCISLLKFQFGPSNSGPGLEAIKSVLHPQDLKKLSTLLAYQENFTKLEKKAEELEGNLKKIREETLKRAPVIETILRNHSGPTQTLLAKMAPSPKQSFIREAYRQCTSALSRAFLTKDNYATGIDHVMREADTEKNLVAMQLQSIENQKGAFISGVKALESQTAIPRCQK